MLLHKSVGTVAAFAFGGEGGIFMYSIIYTSSVSLYSIQRRCCLDSCCTTGQFY